MTLVKNASRANLNRQFFFIIAWRVRPILGLGLGVRVIKPSDLMTLVKNASRENLNRQFYFIICEESAARFAEVLTAP